jgi:5-methylthioadenosine/S-adenosylhomocysteine deaminase
VLDADTVFGWATKGGARALGLPDLGRLEPGCRADLVLLDPAAPNLVPVVDGTGIVVHAGSAANVRHLFRDGEHLVADRLWARARWHAQSHG